MASGAARTLRMFTVDSFTGRPFAGNPAGVCFLPAGVRSLPDATLARIAAEMNLSETAFVGPPAPCADGSCFASAAAFDLRWFTPTVEVDLCGHATLATAAALFFEADNRNPLLRFATRSGELTAERDDCSGAMPGGIAMMLPLNAPAPVALERAPSALTALLAAATCGGRVRVAAMAYSAATKKLLARLDDATPVADLMALRPDAQALLAVDQAALLADAAGVKGVILTLRGSDSGPGEPRFYSRYFAPWVGIPEDPVTGSAHTVSAPYWAAALGIPDGSPVLARQCSPRSGDMLVTVRAAEARVRLVGQAFVVLEGKLRLREDA